MLLDAKLDHLFEQRDLAFNEPEELADALDVNRGGTSVRSALQVSHDLLDVPGPARVFHSGSQERVQERSAISPAVSLWHFVLEPGLPELGVTLLGRLGHPITDRLDRECEPEGRRVFQAGLRLREIYVAELALAGFRLEDDPAGEIRVTRAALGPQLLGGRELAFALRPIAWRSRERGPGQRG